MHPPLKLSPADFLPADGLAATLVGRVWLPAPVAGPAVVALRGDGVYDISAHAPTVSTLLERDDAVEVVRRAAGTRLGSVEQLLAATEAGATINSTHFLAPCDLQVVKAAGVTFASSLLERVIEERAGGDLRRAQAIRADVEQAIGTDLRAIQPGSPGAQELKALLVKQGMWSQYLEVGIGPDAEVFTKSDRKSVV